MSDSLHSTTEVARLFKINRVTIYRWVQEGTVKAYKIGKHLKIPSHEVERLWREFGFPGVAFLPVPNIFEQDRDIDSINPMAKNENHKKMILSVGTDENDLKIIQDMFNKENLEKVCRLVTVSDTLDAALAIGREKPDLLLIKIKETEGNGIEFARKIKGIHSDIKIIFMTAFSTAGVAVEKMGVGDPVYFPMPAAKKRLYREIIETLGLSRLYSRGSICSGRVPGRSIGNCRKKGGGGGSVNRLNRMLNRQVK